MWNMKMSYFRYYDLLKICLLLSVVVTVCAVDLTPEVRELRYSVKQSRRDNGACPGEIVALSCLVYGDRLFWEISWRDAQSEERTFPIGGFTDSNTTMQGNGFWRQVLIRESRFNFSGVLDFISSTDDGCLPLCQSTIAVIPDNNDSNIEFNIICNTEASTGNSERVSKTQVHTISTEMACIGTGIETPTCPNSGIIDSTSPHHIALVVFSALIVAVAVLA